MRLLDGKHGLVLGVANKWSIAWAIARAAAEHGARLIVTYQNERFQKQVQQLVDTLPGARTAPCDVAEDAQLEALRQTVQATIGHLDFVVHSIAHAHKDDLEGPFYPIPKDRFLAALDISAYSLVAVVRALRPLMQGRSGSVLTMTYIGSERVMPNYNVMGIAKAALEAIVRYLAHDLGPSGIRVNAISAGPIKTLAASGIGDFSRILEIYQTRSPLRRNITQEDVAQAAVFLLSDMASAITGTVLYVDAGFHIMGV
ncbi:MAG: enoyl-ACP reductase [Acidobacteria bacterium]|nr:enoyl-ACP reductase [Acidobacteriota bacterium]MDW7984678.1 enoyl-ACP reductase [Acidobacteriota bacterium]